MQAEAWDRIGTETVENDDDRALDRRNPGHEASIGGQGEWSVIAKEAHGVVYQRADRSVAYR